MVNQEHFNILKHGVEAWNQWREHGDSLPDLRNADLNGADLSGAIFNRTNLTEATLSQCSIYGIAVWDVQFDGAKQDNLVITRSGEPTITIDNLEVAQFIYLLLNNPKIRDVIDTITSWLPRNKHSPCLSTRSLLSTLRVSLAIQLASGYCNPG